MLGASWAVIVSRPSSPCLPGKPAQKASAVVLGIATLTVLHVCIPQVALTNFRQGPLPGFWLWAAARSRPPRGSCSADFRRFAHPSPAKAPLEFPQRGRTRPRGWFCSAGLHSRSSSWRTSSSWVVSLMGRSREVFRVGSPFSSSTGSSSRRFWPWPRSPVSMPPPVPNDSWRWRLGFLGLLPFLSINRPADQPFEALAPLLVSYLTVVLAAAGLLVAAGFLNRNRKAPAGLAGSASAELPDRQGGTPEVSRAVARQSAAGCRVMLAGSGALARPRIARVPL